MSDQQISAVKGIILAVVAALVTFGLIDANASDAVVGVVVAVLTAIGAFVVKRPQDHT